MINQIKKEIEQYKNPIKISGNLEFNQKEMVETIFYYYLSEFKSGRYDDEGFRKYFYNIVKMPCKVETKEIDFDTKNIRLLNTSGGNRLEAWLLERDLRFWMKDEEFGKVLNRIFRELPMFGSCVIKTVDGNPHFVDLRNLIVQQDADSLEQASYIIEKHYYNPTEFKKIAKKRNWNNVKEALKEYKSMGDKMITVYERYGEVEEDTIKNKKTILAKAKKREEEENIPDITLAEEETDEIPYFEFHREKIPGRWLGLGKIEELVEPQVRMNEITNLKVKSSYLAAKQLFQTRDDSINRNILTEVRTGEILNVESEVTQVATEDRNLSAYNQEEQMWLNNRDEVSLSYEVMRGERLPSGTPAQSAQLAASQMAKYFKLLQQNIALQVKKYIIEEIIPKFEKFASTKHTLRLVGEDLQTYNEMLKSQRQEKELMDFVKREGKVPNSLEQEMIKVAVEERKESKEKVIPAPDYKNINYKVDVDITGEARDTRIENANLQMAMQIYFQSPDRITKDPTARKLFTKLLERAGITWEEFEQTQGQSIEQVAQKGGGISRPNFPSSPQTGQTETTI